MIITSPYVDDVIDLTHVAETPVICLPKPCPPDKLTAVISRCLQGR